MHIPDYIEQPKREGRIGIIDIGSNSTRLVVYDELKRAPVSLYNEKVVCQLGKGLASSGMLNPEGVVMAEAAITRFLGMARLMEVTELHVIATAAVRDAKDGAEFMARIERKHNITVSLITGAHEARLGAYGIAASVHEPKGICGDLGGGSMELVALSDGAIDKQMTLPLGVLRLADEANGDTEKLRRIIKKNLESVAWLEKARPKHFYAIGGSFRAIGKMHLEQVRYPLHIVHEYSVPAKVMLEYLHTLSPLSAEKLEALPGSGKRGATLPAAIVLLEQLTERMKPEFVTFSASGIREGYLYEKLSPYVRQQDALLSACAEIASKSRRGAYASELLVWMTPLFAKEKQRESRLRLAFCLLSDIAAHIHPEYRARWAMERILYSNLTGLNHQERVQLALALYHRYQFRLKDIEPALNLIGAEAKSWAAIAGAAVNLAHHISGGIAGNLHKTSLKVEKDHIQLLLTPEVEALEGEIVHKRLTALAEAWAGRKE